MGIIQFPKSRMITADDPDDSITTTVNSPVYLNKSVISDVSFISNSRIFPLCIVITGPSHEKIS